jgi:hypothetical protein
MGLLFLYPCALEEKKPHLIFLVAERAVTSLLLLSPIDKLGGALSALGQD